MAEPNSRTLVRGLRILALFGTDAELTQAAAAERLGLPLPTVTRLCKALIEEGFLERGDGRRLALGPTMRQLKRSTPADPVEQGRRWLTELNTLFDEDVNMAVLDGTDVLYVASLPSTQALNARSPLGSRAPAHTVAVGKALLARLSESVLDDLLGNGPYERLTPETRLSRDALDADLAEARKTGVARTWEEYAAGIASFAIALPRYDNEPPTALAVTMPTVRCTPARVAEVVEALAVRAGGRVSGSA